MKYTVMIQIEADSAFDAWMRAHEIPLTLSETDVKHALSCGITELKVFSKDDRGMVHWKAEPPSENDW